MDTQMHTKKQIAKENSNMFRKVWTGVRKMGSNKCAHVKDLNRANVHRHTDGQTDRQTSVFV